MILFEDALKILADIPVSLEIEEVQLEQSFNRILAQDVQSGINMPPFNKSAMDGYALLTSDRSDRFRVVETIAAGDVPARTIQSGECAKIMTGGMIPEGADRVIKKEFTAEEDGFMRIVQEEENRNICDEGEDVRTGDVVLKKNVRIRPAEIGVMASIGVARVLVYARPKVGIIATGSELIEPGQPLKKGKIYDSNSHSLAAQVEQLGAALQGNRVVEDTTKDIARTVGDFFDICDVLLLSGGVSVGEFDYVPGILRELGVHLHFEKVAIKPGKPTVFGTRGEKMIFGIPGNPVSTFVIFEIFIKPLLNRMMGSIQIPDEVPGILKDNVRRRKTERTEFIPVRLKNGNVELLTYHGSAHIHALSQANGLICIPRGIGEIPAGGTINVRPI